MASSAASMLSLMLAISLFYCQEATKAGKTLFLLTALCYIKSYFCTSQMLNSVLTEEFQSFINKLQLRHLLCFIIL